MAAELVIARKPDPGSAPGLLLLVPLGDGLVFRTSDTWPRTKALYCHPVDLAEWDPAEIRSRGRLREHHLPSPAPR